MSDLREALESAVEEHTPAAPETVSAPVEVAISNDAPLAPDAPSATASNDASDNDSVSAKTDAPASIEEVVSKTTDKSDGEVKAETSTDPRAKLDRAPQSWKGEAKKVWEQLPLQVRQEVARRERDITTKLNEMAPTKQRMDSLMQVLTPHQERIQSIHGGNPLQAIDRMLNVERVMFSGSTGEKAQLVANMIKEFKVDITTLDELLSGGQMPPQVQQQTDFERMLEQRLAPMQQFIQNQQQQEQRRVQQVEQEAVHTVESMAMNPEFPYFEEVREDMADIIEIGTKRGIYISVTEAYNKAVRMNDSTFQASNTRSTTQAATNAALTAHQEAQRAKGAALSVSGAPSGVGTNFGNPSDLRGTIAAALGNTGGRV